MSLFGHFRRYLSFESSPVSVKVSILMRIFSKPCTEHVPYFSAVYELILWAWNISLFSVKRALSHFLHVNANDILTATGGRKKQITANKTPDETLQEVLKLWIKQFYVKYFNLNFFFILKKEIIFYKVPKVVYLVNWVE